MLCSSTAVHLGSCLEIDTAGREAGTKCPPTSHEDLEGSSKGRSHLVWGRWNVGYILPTSPLLLEF